ncbi:GMC oxidoreductase [Nitrosococcus halophilus Nc 4]|uniref:GMC oxidoreductase n=1 Tax=Nitrosococcus halophilus (strain Nc4) TaxID=472759 RepID=D5C022_NITHN|nr:GMC family oxidoreductase [Nitrosococcus halophilus]ADE16269.1 GMC oxidoreductase [Nitrosococcus halophilus Nc 4]
MLIDARSVPRDHLVETDICIVGAGAAGITLARELRSQPFRVCLLESGGLEFDAQTQALYEGENIGQSYYPLASTRLRYFGGSTNHWVGACRPLDPMDFEKRSWVPYSGWPFGREELDSYYQRAHRICQLGPYTYEPGDWLVPGAPPPTFKGPRAVSTLFQFSPPTRFGQVYREEIEGAPNIATYLHANVVEFETLDPLNRVARARVACLDGKRFQVAAKQFVLAVGGIENARILLLSNRTRKAGLGNEYDLVGRFFMEHPHLYSGMLMPVRDGVVTDFYETQKLHGVRARGAVTISEKVARQENLVNFSAFLRPYSIPGLDAFEHIVESLGRGEMPEHFLWNLKRVMVNFDEIAGYAYRRLRGQENAVPQVLVLHNRSEQVPNPDSRVRLSNERDALGQNRVALDWKLSAIDKHSLQRSHELVALDFGAAGLGRMRVELDGEVASWPAELGGGNHHMGTTRMHRNPKLGVVDPDCRVHGIANLYVAGSSVFPTSGCSNPTLTIVALAVRLADHLKGLMRRGEVG